MEITQIYNILNTATSEVLGESTIVQEDLSNIVDVGESIFNSNAVDRYVKALINTIGKMVFTDRKYNGIVPSVLMDNWTFGSVCEKISMELPDADENESWELQDGASYDPNIFYKPKVYAKFFNKMTTFEIPISITEVQVRQSFNSAEQMGSFFAMITTGVENALTVKTDALTMRTINNFIATTLKDEYPDTSSIDYDDTSTVKAVNLFYLYKTEVDSSTSLTADTCIHDPDFIRYAIYVMGLYEKRLRVISTLFNIGSRERFTPADRMQWVLHADFAIAASVYLQSDTYHDNLVALPSAAVVPYWQGSGTGYAWDDTSAIKVKLESGAEIDASGIIGVVYDYEALGISLFNRRVTTHYNAKAEFTNNWHKQDARYFNDFNENFVVFFVA